MSINKSANPEFLKAQAGSHISAALDSVQKAQTYCEDVQVLAEIAAELAIAARALKRVGTLLGPK